MPRHTQPPTKYPPFDLPERYYNEWIHHWFHCMPAVYLTFIPELSDPKLLIYSMHFIGVGGEQTYLYIKHLHLIGRWRLGQYHFRIEPLYPTPKRFTHFERKDKLTRYSIPIEDLNIADHSKSFSRFIRRLRKNIFMPWDAQEIIEIDQQIDQLKPQAPGTNYVQ